MGVRKKNEDMSAEDLTVVKDIEEISLLKDDDLSELKDESK